MEPGSPLDVGGPDVIGDELPETDAWDYSQNAAPDQLRQRLQEKIAEVQRRQRIMSGDPNVSPRDYKLNDQGTFLDDRATDWNIRQTREQGQKWIEEAQKATSDEEITSRLKNDPYQVPPERHQLEEAQRHQWEQEWQKDAIARQQQLDDPLTGGLEHTDAGSNLGINSQHLKGDGASGGQPNTPSPSGAESTTVTAPPATASPTGAPSTPPADGSGSGALPSQSSTSGLPGPGDVAERSIPPGGTPAPSAPAPQAGPSVTPLSSDASAEQVIQSMTPQPVPSTPPSYPPPPPRVPSAEQVIQQTLQQPPIQGPYAGGVPFTPIVADGVAVAETAGAGIAAASVAKVVGAVVAAAVAVAAGVAIKNAVSGGSSSSNTPSSVASSPAGPGNGGTPDPGGAPAAGGDSGGINGRYTVKYGDAIGGCGAQLPPDSLTVSVSGATVSVTLGNRTMRGPWDGAGAFTAVNDSPSQAQKYTISGTVQNVSVPVTIQDGVYSVTDQTAGCGYKFVATHV